MQQPVFRLTAKQANFADVCSGHRIHLMPRCQLSMELPPTRSIFSKALLLCSGPNALEFCAKQLPACPVLPFLN